MGIFDNWFGRNKNVSAKPARDTTNIAVSAKEDEVITVTFNNRNITYNGDLASFDYDSILRDKQNYNNITSLFQLSDYYIDADPLYRGIIKEVYAPFAMADRWKLVGADEKVKQKYEEYYERIHLRDVMTDVFLEYFKYGNVYLY